MIELSGAGAYQITPATSSLKIITTNDIPNEMHYDQKKDIVLYNGNYFTGTGFQMRFLVRSAANGALIFSDNSRLYDPFDYPLETS